MSSRSAYPAGVPCWVDLLVADPDPSLAFYAGLFGWEFTAPGAMPDGGGYRVARLHGDDVAAIGTLPAPAAAAPPAWNTYVAVESIDAATERARAAGAEILVGPFAAPPAGRGAALRAPDGAELCLWEAVARQGAQRVNEPSAWAMSLLQTPDPDRARRFYGELFGWEEWAMPGAPDGVVLWRRPGYVGGEPEQPVPRDVVAALMPAPDPAAPAGWAVDFWIADADGAAAFAVRAGGAVIVPGHDAPPFRRAVLAGPEGAVLSVSQLVLP